MLGKIATRVADRIRGPLRLIRNHIMPGNARRFPELSPELTTKGIVMKAPPLTKEMVRAIRWIVPQLRYRLTRDERSRTFWELDQNAACWGEYAVLSKYVLQALRPAKILEIGPGTGRSVIFFTKKFGWEEAEFHLYEGDVGKSTSLRKLKRCPMGGPRFDSFYGSIPLLKQMLEFNGIRNYRVFNAREIPYANLPGPYGIIYSFHAIGFHWSLEHFIDEIAALMDDRTLAFFIVHDNFTEFEKLKSFNYRIERYLAAFPKGWIRKMLVVSKGKIPDPLGGSRR